MAAFEVAGRKASSLLLFLMLVPFPAAGGEHVKPRVLPENAVQPAGASFEGYPSIGSTQIRTIAGDIAGESLHESVRHPLHSLVMSAGRGFERLGVRAWELTPMPYRGNRTPGDASDPYDPNLGGPFGSQPTPAGISLLPDSEPAIQALLALIPQARYRIDLMMYGWDDDETGREVAFALIARARSGVRVRVLTDHAAYFIHNAKAARGCPTYYEELLATPNVTILLAPDPFLRLDHRKLAVVDDRVAWSGGMILTQTARVRWHNLAYIVKGPVVGEFGDVFGKRWRDCGGSDEPPCPGGFDYQCDSITRANAQVRLIQTDIGVRTLKHAIYHAVDHARKNIYIENCYFTDEILISKLAAAAHRGVDVKAVLTLRGNVKRVNQDMVLTANWLLKGGVKVYLYPGMTHVKAMSADGVWSYIGTGNFDELSLRNNREVGLAVSSASVTSELDRTLFERDLAVSEEIHELLPKPRNWLLLEAGSLWY